MAGNQKGQLPIKAGHLAHLHIMFYTNDNIRVVTVI